MRRFLKPDATDENWEYYGKECPYFGVVSWQKFRPGMNLKAKEEFFETGEAYVERLFAEIKKNFRSNIKPRRALDFGCGVGRLLIPLAKRCDLVTGVDVASSMLAEAKKNCIETGCENVYLASSLGEITEAEARFDFVHSFIVFQHIRPNRGLPLFAQMIELLEEDGVGAIHLTYSNPAGKRDRGLLWAYRKFPILFGIAQVLRGRAFSEPLMDMAEYPLNPIFAILQEAGCHECYVRFTHHGVRGMTLLLRKQLSKKSERLFQG